MEESLRSPQDHPALSKQPAESPIRPDLAILAANGGAEFSIGDINNSDNDRVCGHHRLVEVRPDIPQLCYITRNYFMYYLTVPVYLLRD